MNGYFFMLYIHQGQKLFSFQLTLAVLRGNQPNHLFIRHLKVFLKLYLSIYLSIERKRSLKWIPHLPYKGTLQGPDPVIALAALPLSMAVEL